MALSTLTYNGDPEQSAAAVSRAQWNRYKNTYTPVEDQLIGSLNTDLAQPAMELAQGSNERAAEMQQRMQSRYGATSVAPEQAERAASLNDSLALNSAFNTAELAEQDRNDNVRASLVGVGQGILNQATGGLTSASNMQNQRQQANANAQAQADAQRSQRNTAIASTAIMAAAMFM